MDDSKNDNSDDELGGLLHGGGGEEAENALNISSREWLSRAKAVKLSPTDILKLLASGIDAFISEVETRERLNPPPPLPML